MAGHSQFKNIMHRKGAQDAKRAKVFTKLIRELTVAARTGSPDINTNPRLRAAVLAARAANMPKDTVERAIKRGSGAVEGENFIEVRYEGYGPGGIAVIVEALTDNRNRTAGEVRAAFTKYGGALGETNSVSFMFDRFGQVIFESNVCGMDEMLEAALEAGADDCQMTEDGHEILCMVDSFNAVREALEAKFKDPKSSKLIWRPKNTVPAAGEKAQSLLKMLDVLDDLDDVQSVWANFDIAEDELQKLAS